MEKHHTALSLHSYAKERQERDTAQLVNCDKVRFKHSLNLTENANNLCTSWKACVFWRWINPKAGR